MLPSCTGRCPVIILRDEADARQLAASGPGSDLRIFAASPEAALECHSRGLSYQMVDTYYDLQEVAAINTAARDLSAGWWRDPSVQQSCPTLGSYEGITPGLTLHLPFYHLFSEAVRSVVTARALIHAENPDPLVLFESEPVPDGPFWFGLNLRTDALRLTAAEAGVRLVMLPAPRPPKRALDPAMWKERGHRLMRRASARIRRPVGQGGRVPAAEASGGARRVPSPPRPEVRRIVIYAELRHGDALLPLIRALLEQPDLDLVFLTQDMSPSCLAALEEAGAALYDPEVLWTPALEDTLERDWTAVRRSWPALAALPRLREIGKAEIGVSLWPLVEFQFRWLFTSGFADALRRIKLAKSALACLRPDLLISPVDSSLHDLCWILPAKSMGVPCLTPLHGVAYLAPKPWVWGDEHADHLAIWGPLVREWYVTAHGRRPEELSCVGNPLFHDYAARYSAIDIEAVRAEHNLDPKRPVILFLVSMAGGAVASFYRSPVQVYEALFEGLSGIPEAQIIVRTHPAADRKLPAAFAREHRLDCWVNPPSELLPLLKAADVVIGQPTTALLEAMIVEKPVIFFGAMMAPELAWWPQISKIASVDQPDRLAPLIRIILEDPGKRQELLRYQKAFVDQMHGPIDSMASERTIEVIRKMLSDRAR